MTNLVDILTRPMG